MHIFSHKIELHQNRVIFRPWLWEIVPQCKLHISQKNVNKALFTIFAPRLLKHQMITAIRDSNLQFYSQYVSLHH